MTMTADASSHISTRGAACQQYMPKFFDVLEDLWHPETNPGGIINLGLAENSLMHSELIAFAEKHRQTSVHNLTYGDGFSGSKRLKDAACRFLNRQFRPYELLQPSQLMVTPGVSNAIESCAWALCDPGDCILIGRPYWYTFNTILGARAGVNVREVSFGSTDPFGLESVLEYERECTRAREEGQAVRGILLCNPHNPTGQCYPKEVLESSLRLCQRLGIHLICDEIYGLSVWDDPKIPDIPGFHSILSIDVNKLIDPKQVHMLWGMSKDFGAAGLRIGFVVSQRNTGFLKAIESISLMSFPSSLADNAVASLLEDEEFTQSYVLENKRRLVVSYHHVTNFLDAHQVPYKSVGAGHFVMARLGSATRTDLGSLRDDDDEIVSRLRGEKVYVTSGAASRSEQPGWIRIVIAHPIHVLEEGLKRISRAVLQHPGPP